MSCNGMVARHHGRRMARNWEGRRTMLCSSSRHYPVGTMLRGSLEQRFPCPAAAGSPLLLEACRWRRTWRLCVPSSPAFTSFPTTTATDRSILRPPGCSSSHGRQLSHEASPGALNRHWLAPSCSMLSMAAYLPSCLDLLCLGIALAARTLFSLPTFPCFTFHD